MLRRFLSVFVFVVILAAFPLFAVQATAPAAATRSDAPADRVLVVRIYYADRAELAALSARLDVWAVHPKEGYLEAGVTPAQYFSLLASGYRVEIDTAQTTEINRPNVLLPGQINAIPGYPCYRTVEETFAAAQAIATTYPTLAQWIDVGDSWEKTAAGGLDGYDLLVLKLTNQNTPGPKSKLFVMSSMHAREYAPAELNLRYAEYLISHYGVDPDVTWLLDTNEIHLLLQANPDGRKHAEAGLSWRKNTNNAYCANTNSRGADLNRNYPFQWGGGGSSGDECNETYRGPSAASEPETQAVIDYVQSQYPDLRPDDLTTPAPITTSGVFLDLHSFSELVLWPWGFTNSAAPNGTALQTLGRKFAYFNNYEPQQAIGLYPTDGTTDDFAYGMLGLPAYTFEMGTSFFQACTAFDNTIVPDNLPALVYAAKATRRPYQTPAGPDALSVSATPTTTVAGTLVTLSANANDTRFNNSNGSEPTQNIASARYTIDAPSWVTGVISYPLSAADGTFNSSIESITAQLNTTGIAPGRHHVFVETQDADGNWGVPTAAFIWISAAPDSTLAGFVQTQGSGVPIEDAVIRATLGPTLTFETLSQADGSYQLGVVTGTYSLNAAKYGYLPTTINPVTASLGLTTTQNMTLTPAALHVVSGTVRDQLTNRPLAANVNIGGYPGGSISTNPTTGFYSVTLAAGITYTFQVSASGPGYLPASRSVGPLTTDRTESFALSADLNSCTAAGYSWAGVKQAFEASTVPVSWTVVNNVGSVGWRFDNPKPRTNYAGGSGNFAIADSDHAGPGVSMNTELRTPVLDFSALSAVTLTFKTDFHRYSAEMADVDVSRNGASGPWTTVWRKSGADYRGPRTEALNLTALAAGQSNVMIRFHYYDAVYEWWWEVDDVQLGQCLALPYTINLPIITSALAAQSGTPGALVTYTLQVSNTDVSAHAFNVTIDNNNWPTTVATPIGPLAAHGAQPFTVTVVIPVNAPLHATDVAHLMVSAQDDAALSATTTLTTTANARPSVLLDPATSTQSGDPGTSVTYTLNVSNTDEVVHTFDVTIENNSWPTTVATPIGPLAAHGTQPFTVTVVIPVNAPLHATDVAHLMVSAQDDAALSATTTLTTTANARPSVILDPATSTQFGDPGASVTYTLYVSHTDVTSHTFDITLAHNSWPTTITTPIGPLPGNVARPVTVTLAIPTDTRAYSTDIVYIVAGAQDGLVISDTAILTTTANFIPGIDLAPTQLARTAQAGEWVTYTLNLTNTGNFTDTFAVDYSGNHWDMQGPLSVTLATWTSTSLFVTVHVPPTATNELSDTVHITATGAGVFAFSDLITTASRLYTVYLPLILK